MPPREYRRRAPAPRPQTARCRFVNDGRRCTSIATVDGFCQRCADELEETLEQRSPLASLIDGLFGIGAGAAQRMVDVGAQVVTERLAARAGVPPQVGAGPRPAPGPAAPRRASPEAIARKKAELTARGVLGFDPDQVLDQAAIKNRRKDLARLYTTDGHAPDPTRLEMMKRINTAADLLLAGVKPRPAST